MLSDELREIASKGQDNEYSVAIELVKNFFTSGDTMNEQLASALEIIADIVDDEIADAENDAAYLKNADGRPIKIGEKVEAFGFEGLVTGMTTFVTITSKDGKERIANPEEIHSVRRDSIESIEFDACLTPESYCRIYNLKSKVADEQTLKAKHLVERTKKLYEE